MSAATPAAVVVVGAVLLPAALAALLLLPGPWLRRVPGPAAAWAAAGLLGVLALTTAVVAAGGARVSVTLGEFVAGSALTLHLAGPAVVLLPVVLGVASLVMVGATAAEETRERRFAGLMLLFAAAVATTLLADSLPVLLLGWELMGACSYALIGYRYGDVRRVGSGQTAFLVTRTADLGLYVAAGAALAGGVGGLGLDGLAGLGDGWRDVAAVGVVAAALGKAAQLPFSFWLARAMDGPSPVSALLHSAAMVAMGGYLLVRVEPLLAATPWVATATAWTGAVTALVLGVVAVLQRDLKQLLAASTAAQLGFVVLAAGVGAGAAGTAHLVAHAAVKALLFLAAGAWLEALGSKQLPDLQGVARRWPALGLLSVAAFLALAGTPPLALWFTKDAVLAGALEQSPALYVTGLAAAGVAAAYAVVALVVVAGPRPDARTGAGGDRGHVPRRVPAALAPLAVGAVAAGVLVLRPLVERLPGGRPAEPTPWELALSAAVVLVVGVATGLVTSRSGSRRVARRGPVVGLLRDWLALEALSHRLVVGPVLSLARGAARLDDRVLARGVRATGGAVVRAARAAGGADDGVLARAVGASGDGALRAGVSSARGDGRIAAAVDGLAGLVRSGGRALRRTAATGQLHHYYLQAVTGILLTLLALVAVALV